MGTVKDFLNHLHRLSDRPQDDRELLLAAVLDNNTDSTPFFTAQRGSQNCPINRCQALSVSIKDYNQDEENIDIIFRLLFRNEESAEDAAWDYNAVADHMQASFHIDVIDIAHKGRLITGTATARPEFLHSLR